MVYILNLCTMMLRALVDNGRRHHCRIPSIIVRSSQGVVTSFGRSLMLDGGEKRFLSTSSKSHYIKFDQQRTIYNLLNLVEFTPDEFDTLFDCILLAGTATSNSDDWQKNRGKRRTWVKRSTRSSRSPVMLATTTAIASTSSSLPSSNRIVNDDDTKISSRDLEAYLLTKYQNMEATTDKNIGITIVVVVVIVIVSNVNLCLCNNKIQDLNIIIITESNKENSCSISSRNNKND